MITERDKDVFNAIKIFININGYSPTVREIAKMLDITSPATVQAHINKLKDKRYITLVPNMNRTIRILKECE